MKEPHSFYIPVMGTGFTIDTPLKVARFGISSVVSVTDDNLIEVIREYTCRKWSVDYMPIAASEDDHRSRRITAYLNLIDHLVQRQLEELRALPFGEGSEITKYFELLDERSALKQQYNRMLNLPDAHEKNQCQDRLRRMVSAGRIHVNIMTKVDRDVMKKRETSTSEHSDALSALKGFAESSLNSSVVLSAGVNLRLFSYIGCFDDFYPNAEGVIRKQVILKVSDYRSALTQGKIFAKKGIWVSEYRVESGLNCGGHVFPGAGYLLGPALREFKEKKKELIDTLFAGFVQKLREKKGIHLSTPPPVRITAQGGIGTNREHNFLLKYYELDGTGWGTPFLLVPEATTVDQGTLQQLAKAGPDELILTQSSPMGVPFRSLKHSASEEARNQRIADGKPGSSCLNGFLARDTEFSRTPICVASRQYQEKKIQQLKAKGLPDKDYSKEYRQIVGKSCICRDLGDGVLSLYGIPDPHKKLTPAVCPGPNLAFFSKIASLKEMVDHIYGRCNLLDAGRPRPNLFVNELKLYVDYLKGLVSDALPLISASQMKYFNEFKINLQEGIRYYRNLVDQFCEGSESYREKFEQDLTALKKELDDFVSFHKKAFAF